MMRRENPGVVTGLIVSVLVLLHGVIDGPMLVRGQVDQANAKAVDGFSAAVVQAGGYSILLRARTWVRRSHAGP